MLTHFPAGTASAEQLRFSIPGVLNLNDGISPGSAIEAVRQPDIQVDVDVVLTTFPQQLRSFGASIFTASWYGQE
ncbi:MAG: hypothetical protein M0C28_05945 [Candidatus Moduliflexus flocculans]|nr:hypothetical protein [Candidatus Moduliflexus flocculans]